MYKFQEKQNFLADKTAREPKPYSLIDKDPAAAFSFLRPENAYSSPCRDGSVKVDISLSKMRFLHQVFSLNTTVSQTFFFTIETAEIFDNLATSKFKMMMHSYKKNDRPTRLNAAMFAWRLTQYHNGKGKLGISMLPVRLNIDQDTLEFMQDYFDTLFSKTSSGKSDIHMRFDRDDLVDSIHEISDDFLCVEGINATIKRESLSSNEPSFVALCDSGDALPDDKKNLHAKSFMKDFNHGASIIYTEFSFSPSVIIKLDYQGKRVRAEQGVLLGLLIGLMNLQCTELKLEDFENCKGLFGLDSCIEFAMNYWIEDIREKQLSNVVGSYAPIRSLVQLGHGISDLFYMPVQEYQREDGHVISGIRRGAQSFGFSTVSASVDIAKKMAEFVHGVSEFAFDVITPDSAHLRRNLSYLQNSRSNAATPSDIRGGLNLALEAVKQGFVETVTDLQKAVGKDRTDGLWPLRSLLRQAPPAAIRPLVLASKAASLFLDGVKNQLNPDERE